MIPPTVDAWLPPPATPSPVGRDTLVVSPELALVDADLRREALQHLPEVRPFAFLERTHAGDDPGEWLVVRTADRPGAHSVPLAAAAYLATAVVRTCAFNLAVFLGVAILVLVVNVVA